MKQTVFFFLVKEQQKMPYNFYEIGHFKYYFFTITNLRFELTWGL